MKPAKKPTENPWISTAHEMPPEGDSVEWLFRSGKKFTGFYRDRLAQSGLGNFSRTCFTHWRHLPSAERVKIPRPCQY